MVLVGHTLEHATDGALKACLHRVTRAESAGHGPIGSSDSVLPSRQSLVLKLRADDDGVSLGPFLTYFHLNLPVLLYFWLILGLWQ